MDLFNSCGEFDSLHFSQDPALYWRRAFILLVGDDAEKKALELNGTDLEGWIVHVRVVPEEDLETQRYELDLARQVFYDPTCIFGVGVGGYDTWLPPNDVKSALTNHFASCGEITHVYLRTAASEVHIYFSEENAETRALALNGSVVRGRKLVTRRLATSRNVVSPYDLSPSPSPGGLLVASVPEHCLDMAPEVHRKVVAFKIARGMI